MRTLAQRAAAALLLMCALFATAVIAVGVVGVLAVRSSARTAEHIASDEMSTAVATAEVGRSLDAAYTTGQQVLRTTSPGARVHVSGTLYNRDIPAVDTHVVALLAMHAGDDAAELAEIRRFETSWHLLRAELNATRSSADAGADAALAARLAAAYGPLAATIDGQIARESADARAGQRRAAVASDRATRTIVGAIVGALIGTAVLAWIGSRLVRRAVEPAEDQVEFADTLQLAQDEEEAHRLLQRYLERSVPGSRAVVLNRNNSADRLEAVTELDRESPLLTSLQHAEPRSCLAVRSGQPHRKQDGTTPLLSCSVCSVNPGHSVCSPLTIGGEVIGAVLLNRTTPIAAPDEHRVRDSVSQAAPVLANLRNLAIAELRAATDALTGLPNKRAVTDTIKRMFAQAARTYSPMSVLMLDLDHFKDINDRFGHPVGDQALADVGAALLSAIRASDFAGRNGGEEFCVLLPDTGIAGAFDAAEKIRELIADIVLPGVDLTVTASIGIATYPDHAGSAERLVRLADAALYVAKRSGRNRSEVAAPAPEPGPGPLSAEPSAADDADGADVQAETGTALTPVDPDRLSVAG